MSSQESTTTTRTWRLKKYSASRPAPVSATAGAEPPLEWDKWSSPTPILTLESASAPPRGGLPAKPTKIALSVHYVLKHSEDHETRVPLLLPLDLLAFSSTPYKLAIPASQMPLKGVFKRDVVALRYIVLLPSTMLGEFRRIQVRFSDEADASRFRELLEGVVPWSNAMSNGSNEAQVPSTTSSNQQTALTHLGTLESPTPQAVSYVTNFSSPTPALALLAQPRTTPPTIQRLEFPNLKSLTGHPSTTIGRKKTIAEELANLSEEEFEAVKMEALNDPGLEKVMERLCRE